MPRVRARLILRLRRRNAPEGLRSNLEVCLIGNACVTSVRLVRFRIKNGFACSAEPFLCLNFFKYPLDKAGLLE